MEESTRGQADLRTRRQKKIMDFKFEVNNSPSRFPINIQTKNWKGSSFQVFRVKRDGYRRHG